ncbi:MAG: sensor histidine kinase [Mycobacteriales bacterium]
MAPAVPFALLGVIQLLAVAGWLSLGAAALFPGLWRRGSAPFIAGVVLLAGCDTATVLRFGVASSAVLGELRVAGLLLMALGMADGALQPRRLRRAPAVSGAGEAAVVVPLGAPFAAAAAGAAAGGLAAVAALLAGRSTRQERDRVVSYLLAAAAAAAGAASACSRPAGSDSAWAVAVLGLHAAAALAAFAVCARLAARSVLAKVVLAILAGVVVTAAGAVGVVGTSVGNAVLSDQVQATSAAAHAQQQALAALSDQVELRAQFVVACLRNGVNCRSLLNAFSDAPGPYFAAELCASGQAATGCQPGRPALIAPAANALPAAALDTLSAELPLLQALRAGGECAGAVLPLGTSPPSLAVVGVVPANLTTAGCGQPTLHPSTFAGVYGVRYTDQTARSLATGGYDVSFLADGTVLASSLPSNERAAVLRVAGRLGQHALPAGGTTVVSEGYLPTVSFQPILDAYDGVQVAELAVSAPSNRVVGPERSVLTRLFLTTLGALVLAGLLALLLGRRVVEPVRRLTNAVLSVRRGELEVVTGAAGRDEVGALSRSFDAMTGALRSMTGRLRESAEAEAELRRRLQTVVDSVAEGLLTTDSSGVITVANPACAALTGEPSESLVGRPLDQVLQLADSSGKALRVAQGMFDCWLRRSDGSSLPIQLAVAPLGDDPGSGTVLLLRDTSRDREVERMKTEFLANVSHELRTPLTPIRGYAELLARRGSSLPDADTYLRTIHESSLRMQRVVDLLVDVAALEAGRVRPEPVATGVGAFIDECLQRWRVRWPDRVGDFRRRVSSGLPDVQIDQHWVGRALDELADNAVKYTAAGTPITLLAVRGGAGLVRISVRDAGPGIPAEQVPVLLGDFSQADASETRRVGGLGLGLSFVRRLAESLGTRLVVASEPGRGSEFSLEFLAVPQAEQRSARRRRRPSAVAFDPAAERRRV